MRLTREKLTQIVEGYPPFIYEVSRALRMKNSKDLLAAVDEGIVQVKYSGRDDFGFLLLPLDFSIGLESLEQQD